MGSGRFSHCFVCIIQLETRGPQLRVASAYLDLQRARLLDRASTPHLEGKIAISVFLSYDSRHFPIAKSHPRYWWYTLFWPLSTTAVSLPIRQLPSCQDPTVSVDSAHTVLPVPPGCGGATCPVLIDPRRIGICLIVSLEVNTLGAFGSAFVCPRELGAIQPCCWPPTSIS